MKKTKASVIILALSVLASMAACTTGSGKATITATPTPGGVKSSITATPTPGEVNVTATPTPATVAPAAEKKTPSIDFEDGSISFAKLYMGSPKSDASAMELADFNGSKALKVTNAKANLFTFVAFDVTALLGDKVKDVASVEVTLCGTDLNGAFNASSGNLIGWLGADLVSDSQKWSVYLKKTGAKAVTYKVPEGSSFTADNNIFMISLESNAAYLEDKANATLYIDDIVFLDKDGKTIAADSKAEFVGPEAFAPTTSDRANLYAVKNPVNFEGFVTNGGAWGQNGFEMPQEFIDALVPGSVIEIEYSSEDGSIWIVMPWAEAGWSRVAVGEAYINGGKTTAQITYEQIAAVCGEDKAAWGAMLQCEAQTAWEVYGIKVGTKADQIALQNAVVFPDFVTSGGGWGQNGFDIPQEIIDALVPGSVIEIEYTSEDGSMWIVMPDAAAGWSRCAMNEALCENGKAYITFEQIAAVCGDDKTTWGTRLQCEAQTAWEVYGIKVGKLVKVPAANKTTEFPDFVTSAGAWSQNGFEMPQEFIDALVPGSSIRIEFASEDNTMWIVMPDAAAGWSRCAMNEAVVKDGYAYISYEQIAAVCGADKTTWGSRLQCEAQSAWEVYSLAVISK